MPAALRISRPVAFLLAILFAIGQPAAAAVEISFYSKELGSSFPHAFITLQGTLDRTGETLDVNYGFTAKSISPAILAGRVKGEIISDHSASYIRASDRHFSLTLSDDEYRQVTEVVERWRHLAQPSYDLNRQNCVHFVANVAQSLGMKAEIGKLMKRPRSFLQSLTAANLAWLQARGARLLRQGRQASR